jgi:hypothetical protein
MNIEQETITYLQAQEMVDGAANNLKNDDRNRLVELVLRVSRVSYVAGGKAGQELTILLSDIKLDLG